MANKAQPEPVDEYTEGLEMQVAELTEALQRERADALNIRRRFDEEKASLAGYYKANVLQELLPAIDNLELALKHVPEDLQGNNYVKGVESVAKQFDERLQSLGLERIKTVGEHFDPHLHEAVQHDEGDGENDVVSEELQSGWKLGDTVIRPAMVKVTKA